MVEQYRRARGIAEAQVQEYGMAHEPIQARIVLRHIPLPQHEDGVTDGGEAYTGTSSSLIWHTGTIQAVACTPARGL